MLWYHDSSCQVVHQAQRCLSEKKMPYDTIASVRTIIKILKFLGLWRVEDALQPYYAIYARVLHIVFTFPYTIMMWIDVIQVQDLEKFSNIMYMSLTELVLLLKVINIWRYSSVALEFFVTITEDKAFLLTHNEECKFWTQTTRRFRFISFMYFFMSLTTLTIAFISVLFSEEYELPFSYAPPFEWRNKRNYWYAYFYEMGAMPVTCLSNCGLDMMQCYMLLHISLCYRLIGVRLTRLGHNASKRSVTQHGMRKVDEQFFRQELIQTFLLHQKVTRLSKQCETIVSSPFFLQIMCSSFVLCFSAYRLQQVSIQENPSQFFVLVLALIIMTLQIFLPCYCGNEVIIHSNALTNAIYSSDWLQCSAGVRKYIFIYMEFLKLPVRIRVGNFFDIGLPLFTKIMNNAYSLMALLFNMNE